MKLRLLTTTHEFSKLEKSWESLTTEPLSSFDWHFEWWKNFGQSRSLNIFVMESDGQPVGIAPFFVDSWIGQKRIRFIGSGKTATDYGRLIVAASNTEAFVDAIGHHLRELSAIGLIEFDGVEPTEPSVECLWKKLESTHWRYDKFIEPSWVLPLSDTWDDFIKSSAKSLRRKIRKASKRLESGELIVRSTQNELDVDQAFKVLVDLHQRRFVSKGERGVFADPRTVNFLQSATRSLCLKNQAEILIGFVGDEPFVAHLYLLGAKGPQLYQSGADPENMKLEPGHLVFTFAVQKAIEQGCEEFDFLRGDESYKSFWGAKPRTLIKTRFVSRAPVPTMINQSYRALRSAKTAGVSIWANCSLPGKTPSPQPK